jgi:RHS repeat-associated protein
MPGRNASTGDYRYGFQGQETDGEITGSESHVSYKYRMHDARLGRFLSLDPLAPKYPHNSPYAFSENRVIDGIELEGLETLHYTKTLSNGTEKLPLTQVGGDDIKGVALRVTAIHRSYTTHVSPVYRKTKGYATLFWDERRFQKVRSGGSVTTVTTDYGVDENGEAFELNRTIETVDLGWITSEVRVDAQKTLYETLGELLVFEATGAVLGKLLGVAAKPLSKSERLAKFADRIWASPKANNVEGAISQINKNLDAVEDAYSGVAKNPSAAVATRNDGRMYGILDDTYVTRHANGNATALTKGHRIEINADGSYSMFNRYTDEVFITKK